MSTTNEKPLQDTEVNSTNNSNTTTPSADSEIYIGSFPTRSGTSYSPTADTGYHVYKTRWYILAVFSILSMLQCTVWNQFGPIYESVKVVFSWTDTQVALMPFYGTLTFTIFVMPAVWITERLGARAAVLLMAFFVSAGMLLRCIKIDHVKLQNILINISGILNGIAGATTIYAPTVISAHWFPQNERKLATTVGMIFNTGGVMVSFLVGPLVVTVPEDSSPEARRHTLDRYFYLTFAEAAVAFAMLACVLFYYPSKPPSPPSPSAASERVTEGASFREIFVKKEFWLVGAPTVLMFASYLGWQPVLGICLEENGVGQTHAGWMGCWSVLGSLLLAPVMGKLADHFPRNLKAISLCLAALSLEGVLYIFLLNQGYVKFNLNAMYFGVILSGTASGALMPLAFELAVEVCYPVDEPTVSGIIGGGVNCVICIFLAIVFDPKINLVWMTWFLIVSWAISFPAMLFWPTKFARSIADGMKDT